MDIRTVPLLQAVEAVEGLLRQLLTHPEATGQDKASVVLTRNALAEIPRRRLGRWTPVNPMTLPPRKAGQKFLQLPQGWAKDWEDAQEVPNA